MVEKDDWGSNPSVRAMRGLFSRMEAAQNELIKRLRLSPFDRRLRYCREEARILFERTISSNRARAEGLDDEESSSLYILCLSWALDRSGIRVPAGTFPDNSRLSELIKESLK
ncbi:MAG: hypothetical protein ISS59_02910 [Desulfobacteraceae bacterium]|nr:hypothetical protein [Desulfobacteraceae bacterium]